MEVELLRNKMNIKEEIKNRVKELTEYGISGMKWREHKFFKPREVELRSYPKMGIERGKVILHKSTKKPGFYQVSYFGRGLKTKPFEAVGDKQFSSLKKATAHFLVYKKKYGVKKLIETGTSEGTKKGWLSRKRMSIQDATNAVFRNTSFKLGSNDYVTKGNEKRRGLAKVIRQYKPIWKKISGRKSASQMAKDLIRISKKYNIGS